MSSSIRFRKLGDPVQVPSLRTLSFAALVGFFNYGVRLTLFVLALPHIGTARKGRVLFASVLRRALISLLIFRDSLTFKFLIAAELMGVGFGCT